MNAVATWQLVELALDLLVNLDGDLAIPSGLVVKKLENWALLDAATIVGALRDSRLEYVDVPPINEVAVQAISSRVTR